MLFRCKPNFHAVDDSVTARLEPHEDKPRFSQVQSVQQQALGCEEQAVSAGLGPGPGPTSGTIAAATFRLHHHHHQRHIVTVCFMATYYEAIGSVPTRRRMLAPPFWEPVLLIYV
jgi:hypothetical protein